MISPVGKLLACMGCGGGNLSEVEGRIICLDCGLVQQPQLLAERSDTTRSRRSSSAQLLGGVAPSDSTERFYFENLRFLELTCERLRLPKEVLERSGEALIKVASKRDLRRHNIRALSVAAIYCYSRLSGQPVSLRQVSEETGVSFRKAKREYSFLLKELRIHPPRTPMAMLLEKAPLGEDGKVIARKILEAAESAGLTGGRNPNGLGASICYMASILSGEALSQRILSVKFQATERTVRNRYSEMLEKLEVVVSL
jgi:transcription initiation factor TFIIB